MLKNGEKQTILDLLRQLQPDRWAEVEAMLIEVK
jgi:hypothetical protein